MNQEITGITAFLVRNLDLYPSLKLKIASKILSQYHIFGPVGQLISLRLPIYLKIFLHSLKTDFWAKNIVGDSTSILPPTDHEALLLAKYS